MTRRLQIPELLAAHRALTEVPQVWVDVSRGLVAPEEAARAMSGRESAALIERSKQLFAPPSAAQERAIRGRALEHAAPARRAWGWIFGGGSLVLATGLALVLALRSPAAHPRLGVTYQVELSGALETERGGIPVEDAPAPDAAPTFRGDQTVGFTLRPSESLDATELEVVVLAQDEQGRARRLGASRRLATEEGVVQVSERLDALGLTAGRWQLVFIVGRPGQLPAELESLEPDMAELHHDHYAVTRVTIRVIGEEP